VIRRLPAGATNCYVRGDGVGRYDDCIVPNPYSDPKRPAGGRKGYTPAELGKDCHVREIACRGVEMRRFACRIHQ
jgi:hypothetical protein